MSSNRIIPLDQLKDLIRDGVAIGNKGKFPAVVLNPDQTVYKFWVKRPRLGNLVKSRSYAKRFIKGSHQLNEEGFTAPKVIAYLSCEAPPVEIVHYHTLPGNSIRDLLESAQQSINLPHLAQIYFDLHQAGIYIRTLHFGNILQDEEEHMALIDCSNVRKLSSPLSLTMRGKNLATPLRYKDDHRRYQEAGFKDFVETYLALGTFSTSEQEKIRSVVNQRLTHH